MDLNGEENFLDGTKFDNSYLDMECSNQRLDRFGDFWGLNREIDKFDDRKSGQTEMVSNDISDFWDLNCENSNFQDHKVENTKMGSDDIVDLLPQDPFDMDISTKVTAITGWLEGINKDFGLKDLGFCTDEIELDVHLYSEFNIVLKGAMRIHQDMDVEMEDVINSSCWVFRDAAHEDQWGMNDHCDGDQGAPSDALCLALNYLGLRDLLSIERVCKALRDVVRSDPLLWRNIHVGHPLSNKITDDILIKLTDRAQGHLHSLSLVHCPRITDGSLNCVFERNPNLKKLSVPECGRLTADGILWNLKVLKSAGKPRLKYLGVNGIFGMTHQHFEEFKVLLGVDSSKRPSTHKPRFLQGGQLSVSSDDDYTIDIEICPKCQQLRVVYDCPSESCLKKKSTAQLCRACTICIKRCINCGRCLNNCPYHELFNFDLLCIDCWQEFFEHQERQVPHKQTSCHFFFYG